MTAARKTRPENGLRGLQTAMLAALLVNAVSAEPVAVPLSRIGGLGQHGVAVYLADGAVSNLLIDTSTAAKRGVRLPLRMGSAEQHGVFLFGVSSAIPARSAAV